MIRMSRMHRPPPRDVRFDGDGQRRRRRPQGASATHRRQGQRRAVCCAQLRSLGLLLGRREGLQDDWTGEMDIYD